MLSDLLFGRLTRLGFIWKALSPGHRHEIEESTLRYLQLNEHIDLYHLERMFNNFQKLDCQWSGNAGLKRALLTKTFQSFRFSKYLSLDIIARIIISFGKNDVVASAITLEDRAALFRAIEVSLQNTGDQVKTRSMLFSG